MKQAGGKASVKKTQRSPDPNSKTSKKKAKLKIGARASKSGNHGDRRAAQRAAARNATVQGCGKARRRPNKSATVH